jgi:hypothetical protein
LKRLGRGRGLRLIGEHRDADTDADNERRGGTCCQCT